MVLFSMVRKITPFDHPSRPAIHREETSENIGGIEQIAVLEDVPSRAPPEPEDTPEKTNSGRDQRAARRRAQPIFKPGEDSPGMPPASESW